MKKVDSGKLVKHIEDAEDWLKKAKDEYNQANPIRGELILNLAQAEVKHAWELSHHQYVSDIKKPAQNRRVKFYVPVAVASVILISAVAFFIRFGKTPLSLKIAQEVGKPELEVAVSKSVAPQKTNKRLYANNIIKQQKVQAQPELPPKIDNQVVPGPESGNSVIIDKDQPLNEITAIDDNNINNGDNNEDNVVNVETLKVAAAPEETRDRTLIQNQPNLQPVSQLLIDEETLTKEASRSLRNGK